MKLMGHGYAPQRSVFLRSLELRLLHSFPTRRSSDLAQVGRLTSDRVGVVEASGGRRDSGAQVGRPTSRWHPALRSEEHTSELQSRRDLVCRLLLEKKKG